MEQVDEVRRIMAAQAVEQSDPNELILTDPDKREITMMAGAPLPKDLSQSEENAFLSERAELMLVRAGSRFPDSTGWFRRSPDQNRFAWVALLLCLLAVTIGFLTNELGPDKRINILSFPLLGIIAWSVLVYLREIVLFSRSRDQLFQDSWLDGLIRLVQPKAKAPESSDSGDEPSILRSAFQLFQSRWQGLIVPVTGARLKALLHLVALLLALSAIGGMYVKGLANEYRAVWESTFFTDSESLRPVLRLILGPAASLTGSGIPTTSELDAMHWKAGGGDEITGENAARWIHWYAITVGLFVLVPRAFLALIWKWRAGRLARTLPFREVSSPYYEHLLATSSGAALESKVIPYAIDLDDELRRSIRNCLETLHERPVEITWMPTIPFGEEEEVTPPDESDSLFPLFNFASTPEEETHLTLLQTLSGEELNRVPFLLLDTTSFDRKADSFADAEKRRSDREKAWKLLLQRTQIKPVFFSRDQPFQLPEPDKTT
jgi:hypothetical protein